MSKKTNAERETIITRAADEQEWRVFSEDPRVIRRVAQNYGPGEPKGDGRVWILPPTAISFRKPRVLGPEERQRLSERLKEARRG